MHARNSDSDGDRIAEMPVGSPWGFEVHVPVMVQDQEVGRYKGMQITEQIKIKEDFLLDGPISKRVAILDFDETGALLPGAVFHPPSGGTEGKYEIANMNDIRSRDFNQVSVFGTVLQTMRMFEEEDTLGRSLSWAFDAPQLLVIPRAGEWANAYYERESHSLQFYFFSHVYTSLSRDIVAHETGHAILDGIAPDLYNAISPQSLALHEAIADLTALMMAFRSPKLCDTVLRQTKGSIEHSTAFSSLAEEFGETLDEQGRGYLRSLLNKKTLDPADRSGNFVSRNEPHALCEVLSGALYTVMVSIHEKLKREYAEKEGKSQLEISNKALWLGRERFKRMIFRALDYLPPGEVSFADYGRAIIAADQASHPTDEQEREWIREEFVRRHMVPDRPSLDVETSFEHEAMKGISLPTLVESDWAAYDFANRNRDLLRIPAGIHFRVRPRLDATKAYYHRDGKQSVRECLFKVSWDREEPNQLGFPFANQRQITVGTTLAIGWETETEKTPKIRVLLTSQRTDRPQELREQQDDRDQMLARLVDEDSLRIGPRTVGADGRRLQSVTVAESANGLVRVRGTARLLHIIAR